MTSGRLLPLVALAAALLSPHLALAKGDASGSLGAGGQVRGDISKEAGETDRITVDLDEGASLTLRFSASFEPLVVITGPHGAPVDVGQPVRKRLAVQDLQLALGGTYEISVSSADGTQGTYTLAVKERWARRVAISGSGASVVDIAMPAGGKLGGVVRGGAGASGEPTIAGLEDPTNASLLAASIPPRGRVAKLPPTPTATAGVYHLVIGTTVAGVAWSGQVMRALPAVRATRLVLSNGLDTVSFAGDGVRSLFLGRCVSCHGWASSYSGVRAHASVARGRIQSGSMPPGGRLGSADVALVEAWIKTGKQP